MTELDWQAVAAEVRKYQAAYGMSTAELSRTSGVSETTIRQVRAGKGRKNKAVLVALSAALSLDGQHLTDVAEGRDPSRSYTTEDLLHRIQQRVISLTAKVDWLIAKQDP